MGEDPLSDAQAFLVDQVKRSLEKPSPVQQRAIVPLLKGRDLIMQAQSGTGKTAAFVIAILQKVGVQQFRWWFHKANFFFSRPNLLAECLCQRDSGAYTCADSRAGTANTEGGPRYWTIYEYQMPRLHWREKCS